MTIAQATAGFGDQLVLLDKLVCQYVADNGARIIWRFVCQNGKIFLRRESISGFGSASLEGTELFDDYVTEELLAYVTAFIEGSQRNFDIFNRDLPVDSHVILTEVFLEGHELEGKLFMAY